MGQIPVGIEMVGAVFFNLPRVSSQDFAGRILFS